MWPQKYPRDSKDESLGDRSQREGKDEELVSRVCVMHLIFVWLVYVAFPIVSLSRKLTPSGV